MRPHETGHFGARLDEAENVVDQQQDVAMLVIPEILGHGECGMANPEPAARQLVHLPEHHDHVGQHSRRLHLAVQLLAFAAALPDAAEQADPMVAGDHVVNHFGQQNGFADAGATEQAGLAAALQGHEHIDRFDPRCKDFGLGGALGQGRRGAMNRAELDIFQSRAAIDGATEYVEHP
jgi:hypothetical protein